MTRAEVSEAFGLLVGAKVCVRSLPPDPSGDRTRISWDPWKVVRGSVTSTASLYDGSHPPSNLFPSTGLHAVGQCVEGNIPFATLSLRPAEIRYANQLGDTATWTGSQG